MFSIDDTTPIPHTVTMSNVDRYQWVAWDKEHSYIRNASYNLTVIVNYSTLWYMTKGYHLVLARLYNIPISTFIRHVKIVHVLTSDVLYEGPLVLVKGKSYIDIMNNILSD